MRLGEVAWSGNEAREMAWSGNEARDVAWSGNEARGGGLVWERG